MHSGAGFSIHFCDLVSMWGGSSHEPEGHWELWRNTVNVQRYKQDMEMRISKLQWDGHTVSKLVSCLCWL